MQEIADIRVQYCYWQLDWELIVVHISTLTWLLGLKQLFEGTFVIYLVFEVESTED